MARDRGDEALEVRPRTLIGSTCTIANFHRQNLGDKLKYCSVELARSLQRSEMAHGVEKDEFRVRNASSEIFRVFAFNRFVMLALCDHDRHPDLGEVMCGVVRLRSPHKADVFDKVLKVFRRSR